MGAEGKEGWSGRGLPVLACHGAADKVVQHSFAQRMWEAGLGQLSSLDVLLREYKGQRRAAPHDASLSVCALVFGCADSARAGLGHGVELRELVEVRGFLETLLPGHAPTR